MGEWSDREQEMGFVDNEGNINVDSEEVVGSNEIVVDLTPPKLLSGREFDHRIFRDLDPEAERSASIYLEHDRYNKSDTKALAVYSDYDGVHTNPNHVFIGHVWKSPIDTDYANGDEIDTFCFSDGILNNISIKKKNGNYVISRCLEDRREDSLSDYEKPERFLFKDHKVQQQASEIETIEHALQNKDAYSFTDYEVEFLESSLTSAKLDHIGKTGKKLASDSVNAVGNIVGGAIDVGVGIFNLFKSKK